MAPKDTKNECPNPSENKGGGKETLAHGEEREAGSKGEAGSEGTAPSMDPALDAALGETSRPTPKR